MPTAARHLTVGDALLLVLGLAASACASRADAGRFVVEPPLSARIVLADTTVTTGGTIDGEVVVANNTDKDLTVIGCGSIFGVALANEAVAPEPQWPACAQEITIPVGESVYPVVVSGQHMACSGASVDDTLVRCENDGSLPPLPPGQYEARLYQSTAVVPAPTPVEVRVTT